MPDVIAQGLPLLSHALAAVGIFKYPLIFVGAAVEGPVLSVACGFLLHTGIFSFIPLYLTLMLGDLAADAGWYALGRHFAGPALEKHGHFLTLTPATFEKLKARFHRHHSFILFISKITMGFGMALGMLTAAGAAKIPFRSFIFWNALGEIVYVAALLSLGYFLGNAYHNIASGFKTVFVIAGGVVIVGGLYLFATYLRRRATA